MARRRRKRAAILGSQERGFVYGSKLIETICEGAYRAPSVRMLRYVSP
jgi:hypothetical protein